MSRFNRGGSSRGASRREIERRVRGIRRDQEKAVREIRSEHRSNVRISESDIQRDAPGIRAAERGR